MALGLVKLSILVALVAGYPLPELSLVFWADKPAVTASKTDPATASTQESSIAALTAPAVTTPVATAPVMTPQFMPEDTAEAQPPSPSRADISDGAAAGPEPQGSAAARAAAHMRPDSKPSPQTATQPGKSGYTALIDPLPIKVTPAPAVTNQSHKDAETAPADKAALSLVASAPAGISAPDTTVREDSSWWGQIRTLKTLPFPRLGVDQAAHAATLDAPPPPALPARSPENSPFAPPAQTLPTIPSGQNPDGSPIAPRSTTAQPLPAGTAGPQLGGTQGSIPSLLVPNDRPPVPKVDSYTPPDDPNRKQQELARREQEVLRLKQQMDQRLDELQAAERKVKDMLEEAKQLEQKKISSLTAMYINMKPKQAAKALETLDERIAVKILSTMAPKQSGEILTYTDPKTTAKLTELISRMRLGQ